MSERVREVVYWSAHSIFDATFGDWVGLEPDAMISIRYLTTFRGQSL